MGISIKEQVSMKQIYSWKRYGTTHISILNSF